VCSALSGVGFCLDFSPFLSSSLVTLLGVFLLFIYLFNGQTQDFDIKFFFALQISLINPKRKEKLDQISFFFFSMGSEGHFKDISDKPQKKKNTLRSQ